MSNKNTRGYHFKSQGAPEGGPAVDDIALAKAKAFVASQLTHIYAKGDELKIGSRQSQSALYDMLAWFRLQLIADGHKIGFLSGDEAARYLDSILRPSQTA